MNSRGIYPPYPPNSPTGRKPVRPFLSLLKQAFHLPEWDHNRACALATHILPSLHTQTYKANFLHLSLKFGWFGILSGSSINFLNVYATRLGASGIQIGMLDGMAAFIGLLLAIPAGNWLVQCDFKKAIFQASLWNRFG